MKRFSVKFVLPFSFFLPVEHVEKQAGGKPALWKCFTYPVLFPRVHNQGRSKRPRRIHTAAGKWNLENKEISHPLETWRKQTIVPLVFSCLTFSLRETTFAWAEEVI